MNVIREYQIMGPCRYADAADANCRIFRTVLMLGKEGKIEVPGNFGSIFTLDENLLSEKKYVEEGLLKKCFFEMRNYDIQRVLHEVSRDTVIAAMKSWDSDLKKLTCGNLPKPVAVAITKDMEKADYDEKEIKEANEKILSVIRRFVNSAEIYIVDLVKDKD